MRKLYIFVNGQPMPEWLDCLSLTDDGHILGGHICSNMVYMMNDLHDRPDRLEKIKAHFNEPYEVEILSHEQCKSHIGFLKALNLANERDHSYEPPKVEITFSKESKE